MRLVNCSDEVHGEAILAIFNHAIATSTAIYEYEPRSRESMVAWFATKQQANFPVLGLESETGELLGFATYGVFREKPAYHTTVEHSVYVRHDRQQLGVGKILMQELIKIAKQQNYHVMIGAIDAANSGSIAFHQQLGFTEVGIIREVGFKFDRWLDLALYQLIVDGLPDG
jgi:L-amino acid N-acyltransferase